MWHWLRSLLRRTDTPRAARDLLVLSPDETSHLFETHSGLPQVDWGMAETWASRRATAPTEHDRYRRAIAGAWLDAVCAALPTDHKRWRHTHIEGLAPIDNSTAQRIAAFADRAAVTIAGAMQPITDESHIEPVAIVALQARKDYYSFIAPFYPDEGEFATSGGVYIRERDWSWPVIAMPVESNRHSLEQTIAHELTHHALSGRDIPLWAEEGLTQMMEERVTGTPSLRFDFDTRDRHADHWDDDSLQRFWSGDAFHSPHEDEQELAYNLSQLIVRGLLTRQPTQFFAFARTATRDDNGEAAAREHLGVELAALADALDSGRA